MNILKDWVAAIGFFTRIPLWKMIEVPAEHYRRMIYFWPLTGWISAFTVVLSWYLFSLILPLPVAVILAFLARILLTGGFHEDGLGDFFDGFGGGRTKADILRIMKDSRIGSYALLGLMFYFLLLITSLSEVSVAWFPLLVLSADPLSKMLTALMMNVLPYARPENESKSKLTYHKLSWWQLCLCLIFGLFPGIYLLGIKFWPAFIVALLVMLLVFLYIKKKIQGYTGDICGATALMTELSFYLAALAVINHLL